MEETRPKKIIRLNFYNSNPAMGAHLTILGSPSEVRLGASPSSFMAVGTDGISLSPGLSNDVNIQGLSHNLKYAGMISDLPFPLSIIPVTIATPLPNQVMVPPMGELISMLRDFSTITKAFVGL